MRRSKHLTKKQKERLRQIGKWAGISAFGYEAFMLLVQQRQKTRDVFNLALQRQAASRKPLLVVGSPSSSVLSKIFGTDYDCADLCIDPKGCPGCPNSDTRPIGQALSALGSGSYVVFVSAGQLEHVDDVTATLQELQRVSGGDLFVAHKNPWTLLSLFGKRRILAAPPTGNYTEWRDLPWMPGPSVKQRVALSGIDTSSLPQLGAVLGVAGGFVGYQLGDKKLLPAIAGLAAGTATAALIVKSKRDAVLTASAS
jgi:hypothetical protein